MARDADIPRVLSKAMRYIVAIAQSNIKRMLAYSTIAHMKFLLPRLLAGTKSGYAGSMFMAAFTIPG